MDNKHIEVASEGKTDFEMAVKIACSNYKKIVGWTIYEKDGPKNLVLHWAIPDKNTTINKLPFEMSIEQAIEFAWGWLQKEPISYSEPDHDGINGKGFEVFNEAWGKVNGDWSACVAIRPIWAMYGK